MAAIFLLLFGCTNGIVSSAEQGTGSQVSGTDAQQPGQEPNTQFPLQTPESQKNKEGASWFRWWMPLVGVGIVGTGVGLGIAYKKGKPIKKWIKKTMAIRSLKKAHPGIETTGLHTKTLNMFKRELDDLKKNAPDIYGFYKGSEDFIVAAKGFQKWKTFLASRNEGVFEYQNGKVFFKAANDTLQREHQGIKFGGISEWNNVEFNTKKYQLMDDNDQPITVPLEMHAFPVVFAWVKDFVINDDGKEIDASAVDSFSDAINAVFDTSSLVQAYPYISKAAELYFGDSSVIHEKIRDGKSLLELGVDEGHDKFSDSQSCLFVLWALREMKYPDFH